MLSTKKDDSQNFKCSNGRLINKGVTTIQVVTPLLIYFENLYIYFNSVMKKFAT